MNRIMLLGLLVCISRVALCGVMGVMAETVARRVHARHAPEERCRRLRRFDKL